MRRIQTDDSGDRQTWEGCLEIAITCNWQCMACIFGANDEGLFFFCLCWEQATCKLCSQRRVCCFGYPTSCWLASWKISRKHPRESVRVSTHGSSMAKEGFLCFRREQCLALACLVCLEPQWYTRACCGEGGREHLWCAVQHVAAQHEQQQWQQQQKRVGAVLSTPYMHTQ